MTEQQIIEWWKQADDSVNPHLACSEKQSIILKTFADLVAANAKAEMRERCAKVCESELAMEVVNASRDYNEGRQMGATVCAQVIRALKD